MANVITRRSFLKPHQASIAAGLASMVNIPLFLQKALAEGNIGLSGKKLLFIFLRGGNDVSTTSFPFRIQLRRVPGADRNTEGPRRLL